MAFFFVLVLLLDSACTASCIPAELETSASHCASGDHGSPSPERGCERDGHLKPVVQDRGFGAAASGGAAPDSIETPAIALDVESFRTAPVPDPLRDLPPLLQRISVLRI